MKRIFALTALLCTVLVAVEVTRLMGGRPADAEEVSNDNGDVNGDGARDITDAIYLLSWLFQGGPEPVAFAGGGDLEERLATLELQVESLAANAPTAEQVADALFQSHREELTGPQGPPGPPGAGEGNAVETAVERLSWFVGKDATDPSLPFDALRPLSLRRGEVAPFALTVGESEAGLVLGFSGEERLSTAYVYSVLLSRREAVAAPRVWLGQRSRLSIQLRDQTVFAVSGIVARVDFAGRSDGEWLYVVDIAPRVSELMLTKGYSILQEMNAVDIVDDVFGRHGVSNFRDATEDPTRTREYVVQYRESDFDFVSRLLEDEGLFYFFEETDSGERLVVADSSSAFPSPPAAALRYYGHGASAPDAAEQYVETFRSRRRRTTGAVTLRAYDFRTPSLVIESETQVAGATSELYEFAPDASSRQEVAALARIRLEEARLASHAVVGTSNATTLRPGHKFRLEDTTGGAFSGEHYVVASRHVGVRVQDADGTRWYYGNEFTSLPSAVAYRPPRVTPRPRVDGVQTGVVVGQRGESTHTEEYGRVKVQFPWDRDGALDETSSAWIRVAQGWAGNGRGAFFLPEVGDEVVVGFVSGDPDRPIIVGSVHNGENPPPVQLPDEAAVSVLRSRSAQSANEIVLDDTAGAERLAVSGRDLGFTGQRNITFEGGLDVALSAGNDLEISSSDCEVTSATLTLQAGVLDLQTSRGRVTGPLSSMTDAGPDTEVEPGDRHRDNAIVAWARVDSRGAVGGREFGVDRVTRLGTGAYRIDLDAAAADVEQLIPVATPLLRDLPRSPEDFRMVSVRQVDEDTFDVLVNDGSFRAADGAFVFLVTSR